MGLKVEYNDGQTPIDEEEKVGLLIHTITTRAELDEFEQRNFEEAILWTLNRDFSHSQVFSADFIRNLHARMFDQVWAWAGEFRKSEKNIGVPWYTIPADVKLLLDDVNFWYANQTYTPDETAIRFKHRLVSIHCFPNGNGRHSRLIADVIIENIYKLPIFSWGEKNLTNKSDLRKAYINSLRAADQGDYTSLVAFARM